MTTQVYHLVYQSPFRTAFSVMTDDIDMVCALKLQYGNHIIQEGTGTEPGNCKSVSILREGTRFRVIFENESYLTDAPLYAFSSILFEHTEYDVSVLALHGAAVEWRGKAYLFLAHTSGGKTTLTSYLVSCGFGYLSDDCILVDRETLTVYPGSNPIHLRRGGLKVLEELGKAPICQKVLTPPNERYVFMPEHIVTDPLPIGDIFFIHRSESKNGIEEISVNQRLEGLMKSPITPYPVDAEYLRLLLRVAERGCRLLSYCDMDYVRKVIQQPSV